MIDRRLDGLPTGDCKILLGVLQREARSELRKSHSQTSEAARHKKNAQRIQDLLQALNPKFRRSHNADGPACIAAYELEGHGSLSQAPR